MYLKSLEMTGFKSFVDSTKLEFPGGLSAVVGPNGCGKSNVIDAIRWVIGEYSTRTLRGNRMEDLIFSGSDTRNPIGMAEVALTVGNLPAKVSFTSLDGLDEVTVTRRYFRSGESEYFINKTPCRMKDIIDLFLDTGISSKSFSIIEQDHVAQIINSKPIERRALIEEAAGIMKYKHRRNEALRKLEHTNQNLLRINDIISELDKQKRSLKRQAKKAEVHKKFRKEARELALAIYSIEYRNQKEIFTALEEKLTGLKDKQEELIAKNASLQNKIETHKAETDETERQLNLFNQQNYEIKGKIENFETRVDMMKKQIVDHETSGEKAEEDIKQWQEDIENINQEIENQRKNLEVLDNEISLKEKVFNEKNDALKELKNSLQAKTNHLEDLEADLVDIFNVHSNILNSEASLTTHRDILEQNKEKLINELTESEKAFTELNDAVEKNRESLSEAKENLLKAKKEKEVLVLRLEKEKNQLKEVETNLNKARSVFTENTALLNSLNELYKNFEGFHEGVKSLMKSQGANEVVQGIHDILINTVEVPSDYEVAFEAVLGEKIQGVIMDSHNESLKAVQYLKDTDSGRSTLFLLKPKLQSKPALSLNGSRGVVGKLSDLINYEEKYKEVMEYLLGNVVVAQNIESALSLWEEMGDNCTIVTLGGDVIDSHGTITGGVPVNNGASLLTKKRKIAELIEETQKLEKQVNSLEEKQNSIKETIESIENEREILEQKNNQSELDFRVEEKKNQQLNENFARAREKVETCKFEKEQCEVEEKELRERLEQLKIELKELNNNKSKKEEEIKNLREGITSIRSELESLTQEVNSIDVKRTSLKGKKENVLLDVQRLEANMELTQNRVKQKENEKKEHENKKSERMLEIQKSEKEVDQLIIEKNALKKKVVEIREALEKKLEELKDLQNRSKSSQAVQEEVSEEVNRFEVNRAEIVKDMQYLVEKVKDEFLVTKEQMLLIDTGEFDLEVGKAKLEEMKTRLNKIGEVNLAALEEYERVNERHTFLSTQQVDLQQSIADLQKTIDKINTTTKKKFLETFELINENFKKIFSRFFKGGNAALILSDNDLLETGIDIHVKPPGKKLQNLDLLSGGEKAMVAISLLFAIFIVRPNPFCLLDEVDAALDQTNIVRFKEMLMEMKNNTQFILITHSQQTMSFAERLYGITMEEKGVSKIVSVNMN